MSYWFGEIPDNWNSVKVKNLFKMVNGGTPKSEVKEYWSDSEVVWVTPEDLSKDGKYISDSIRKISYLGLQNCSANFIKANSITLSTRAPIGNVKVSTVSFTTNQGCKSLEANNKVSINYYYYVMNLAKEYLNSLGQGTTFLELSNYSLKNVYVPYPELNVQNLIGDYLDIKCEQIDKLILSKREQISLLEQQRQSIITEAVTKGLNPNVKMKDSGVEWIGEIPEHWEQKKLKYFVSYVKGLAFKSEWFSEKGVKVVKTTDIKNGTTYNLSNTFISKALAEEYKKVTVLKDDILMSTVGSAANVINSAVGQLGLVTKEFDGALLNQNAVKLSGNPRLVDNRFLFYFLNNKWYREYLNIGAHGTANQASLSLEYILDFTAIFPPKEEQQKITNYIDLNLNQITDLKISITKQIEKLKAYRQSLIYEAVTGKIDVRELELD